MANASPIEEDYEHSPLSTEDEQEECEVRITGIYEKTPSKDSSQKNRASALNKGIISNAKPPRQGTRSQPKRGPSRFKDEIPSRTEGVLVGSKRKSTDTAEIDATDDDEAFLDEWKRSQSQSEKRPKYTYAKSKRPFAEPENIHGNETPRKRRSRASAVPTLESPPKSQGNGRVYCFYVRSANGNQGPHKSFEVPGRNSLPWTKSIAATKAIAASRYRRCRARRTIFWIALQPILQSLCRYRRKTKTSTHSRTRPLI